MDTSHFFQRCKDLAGDNSAQPWTRDHMFGFFQTFRPNGERLESLFADIPFGNSIYHRLQQVFLATAIDWQSDDGEDAYFIVRSPKSASSEVLLKSAGNQLTNWRLMAFATGDHDLVDLLTPLPAVALYTGIPPPVNPHDTESLDVFIYDVQSNWHGSLEPSCPHASWMHEAFYSIGCDYHLANYVTWPWYMHSSLLTDPLGPYFTLWQHGAELRCNSAGDVRLFLGSA